MNWKIHYLTDLGVIKTYFYTGSLTGIESVYLPEVSSYPSSARILKIEKISTEIS
jgi:hypothetical protein